MAKKTDPTILVQQNLTPPPVAPEVRPGDLVTIHYTSSNRDGGVFETSRNRRPLQFVAGRDGVIEGLGEAIIGMRPGDRKTVQIPPERGFGQRDPSLEQAVPRAFLPESLDEGDQLIVMAGDREIDVWVRSVTAEAAVIDANHPLAGEALVVDVEVVGLERPTR